MLRHATGLRSRSILTEYPMFRSVVTAEFYPAGLLATLARHVAVCAMLAGAGFTSAVAWAQASSASAPFPSVDEILRAARQVNEQSTAAARARPSGPAPAASAAGPTSAAAAALKTARPTQASIPSAVLPAPATAGTAPSAADPDFSVSPATQKLVEAIGRHGMAEHLPDSVLRGKLYVAVSFSMPDTALQMLLRQATAAGAELILNGFANTPKQTKERIQVLRDQAADAKGAGPALSPQDWQDLSVVVAPELFKRFDIQAVPTFVLLSPAGSHDDCEDASCAAYKSYVSVSGDVSLRYALEAMERARPKLRPSVQYFASRAAGAATPQERRQ